MQKTALPPVPDRLAHPCVVRHSCPVRIPVTTDEQRSAND
jgi:hypothetical protein